MVIRVAYALLNCHKIIIHVNKGDVLFSIQDDDKYTKIAHILCYRIRNISSI